MKRRTSTVFLAAGSAMLFTSIAAAQFNSGNYGGMSETAGTDFSYSEIDHRRAVERDREYAEKQARDARRAQERKEKEERRRASHVEYVPKKPEEALLVVNYDNATVTADKIVDSMVESQSRAAQAAIKVPPQKQGYKMVTVGDDFYYFKDGVFFIDMGGELAEVPAPPGALVTKLPPGFETRDIDSGRFYVYNDTWYERVMVGGTPAFKVVAKQE